MEVFLETDRMLLRRFTLVRIPGDAAGDVEYAITRADWEAARRGSCSAGDRSAGAEPLT